MANRYKKNLAAIARSNPTIEYAGMEEIAVLEEYIKKEDGYIKFAKDKQWYCLCSKNTLAEAEFYMKDLEETRDYLLVVFGAGNATLLRRLHQKTTDATKIIVIEPNRAVLKYVMIHDDLTSFVGDGKMVVLSGEAALIEQMLAYYVNQEWDNLAKNVRVISLNNYHVYAAERHRYVKYLLSSIDSKLKLLGTSLEDNMNGLDNLYKNIDECISTNSVEEIRDKYQGYPAIIVAAGPSLDKNIHLLKEAEGKALIIACDASYTACKQQGVSPDAVASIERDYPTYQYYYKDRTFDEDLVLLGPAVLWPDIYTEFPGKKLLMAKNNEGMEEWWSSNFENMVFLPQGSSCANVAFAVARYAGCSPIILIGQDLAYTDEKKHSAVTHTEFEGDNVPDVEEENPLMRWTKGIDGTMVKTDIYYDLFRSYFERNIEVYGYHVIDATEGGALIKGTEIMTFREAIDTYCTRPLEKRLYYHLKDIKKSNKEYIEIYDNVLKSADKLSKDLEDIRQKAISHYNKVRKYNGFDFANASEQQLIQVVLDMTAANEIVDYIIEEKKQVLTYYQQNIKQTIIFVKEIGNDLTSQNVERNFKLQVHLMRLVEATSLVVEKHLGELRQFIEEKKRQREQEGDK
ncbi:MAG: DUF115 domain-containing protein [Lachnospiraceae bacterium]|nr:DUF115 domain-containing protein [Lachnospiraceae bacterium]